MSARVVATSALILAVGYAVAGALYFALINVPESNVATLVLSAILVLLIVAVAGVTTALAVAITQEPWRVAARRSVRALPAFVLGLVAFVALSMVVDRLELAWIMRRGEVHAMLLPYLSTRNTTPLHTAIVWLLWLVRWGLGLSLVLGPLVAAVSGSSRRGVRLAVRLVPLAACAIAAIAISEGLWRVVYWRPRALPASWVEVVFVSTKLLVLYLLGACIAAVVVQLYRRTLVRVKP